MYTHMQYGERHSNIQTMKRHQKHNVTFTMAGISFIVRQAAYMIYCYKLYDYTLLKAA